MATQEIKRKLAAILSADVKGYSRLMGEDEKGTVHTLNVYMDLMTRLIQHHRGRVVGTAGDSMLAEFASIVDAVECAVEIQKDLKTRNAELPENRKMEFRTGINLGDVIEDGEQILGDGVNIAARLESLSNPGGICISGTAFDQVKNKLYLGYKYLGEQTVKNISEPVRVYQVLTEPEAAGKVIGEKTFLPRRWQRPALALLGILILMAAAVAVWQFVLGPSSPPMDKADPKKMVLPLPDLPSIAVLPFVNMSGEPKQEFLSDGMTEAIITALSKLPTMFVVARNSTFAYKGKPINVKKISEELGVRYVLEGSVQRSGNRVRITAQLIDALAGNHLWAESYDRDLKDLFALQDEITITVLRSTQVKLEGMQVGLAEKHFKGKRGLDCYLKIMEGRGHNLRFTIEDTNVARQLAEEAIAMCPESPIGYVLLGWVYHHDYWLGNTKFPREECIAKAIELAQKALAMDDSISEAHALLCTLYFGKREYDRAIAEGERGMALNPGGDVALLSLANSLRFAGRSEEAILLYQKAIRLNPFAPPIIYNNFGYTLRDKGRFEEAVSAFKKAIQLAPDHIIAHIGLAATYSMMGRENEARAEAAEVLRINPKFSVDSFAKNLAYNDQSETDRYVSALRKAGLK